MCSGGIHDSGTRPAINSSRRCRASARSFLARFLVPRRALASAGSARCTSAPTLRSSSTTNRHPVVASNATSSSWPPKRPKNLRTPARSTDATWPRFTSPVSVSTQSGRDLRSMLVKSHYDCHSGPPRASRFKTLRGPVPRMSLGGSLHIRVDRLLMPSFSICIARPSSVSDGRGPACDSRHPLVPSRARSAIQSSLRYARPREAPSGRNTPTITDYYVRRTPAETPRSSIHPPLLR